MSVALAGVAVAVALALERKWGVGLLAGTGLSLLFFWTLERMLREFLSSRTKCRRWRVGGLVAGKYALAGVVFYEVVRRQEGRVEAFVLGLCVVYVSVVGVLVWHRWRRKPA